MAATQTEIANDLRPVHDLQADVFVAGGGAAGLAAAVTAARQGCKVIVAERYGFCGGGAVAGLSGTVCGLYEATDNAAAPPNKLVHGFVDDFIRVMEEKGGLTDPVRYGKTYTRVHDPLVWRETADALLREAGVEVVYHAMVTGVLMEDERVLGAQLYTKEGRVVVKAAVTVDATGDADLVAMAGFPSFMGDDGRVQNPTMIFRLLGVDTERFLAAYGDDTIMPPEVSDMIVNANANAQGYRLPRKKIWLFTTTRPGELLCNCTRITGTDGRELNATLFRDFADAEGEGRAQAREYARFFKNYLAGCEDSWINDTGVQVGVRQTRQARGVMTLMNADVLAGTKFSDGIARSPWPIELHAGEKPRVEWLLNDVYEIPFGCFVPERGEGLFTAGRCLSAEHEAVASARVTAQCFSYGHAIGHAAAIAAKDKVSTRDINGADVRAALNRDGARLD